MSSQRNPRPARPHAFSPGRLAIVIAAFALLGGCGSQSDYASRGQKYLEGGQYREAVIEFKNAVQAEPGSARARVLLADALERTHDLAGAEQQLRKAIEAGGDDKLVLRIASIQLDRTEFDKLVREFRDRRTTAACAPWSPSPMWARSSRRAHTSNFRTWSTRPPSPWRGPSCWPLPAR